MTDLGNIDLSNVKSIVTPDGKEISPDELKNHPGLAGLSDAIVKMKGEEAGTFILYVIDYPNLESPDFDLINMSKDGEFTPPTAENLKKTLDKFPEFAQLKEQLKHLNLGDDKAVMSFVQGYLKQNEHKAKEYGSEAVINEGFSKFIAKLLDENPSIPNEFQETLLDLKDSSMLSAISHKDPSISLLQSALKAEYMSQGKTEAEAEQIANSKLMYDLETYFEANGSSSSKVGLSDMTTAAVFKMLTGLVNIGPKSINEGFATGLNLGAGMEKVLVNFANQVSKIEATGDMKTGDVALDKLVGVMNTSAVMVDDLIAMIQNDPTIPQGDKMLLIDFLKQISDMIADLKAVLIEIEMMKSAKSKEIASVKSEVSEMKMESTIEKLQNQLSQIRKARKMKKLALALKIIGPIVGVLVGALAITIGALLAPFTGAISLIVAIIIAVTVMTLMTALIVTLTETGVMDKMFEAMNGALESLADEITGGNAPGWVKKLVQVAVWTAIIVALVAAAIAVSVLSGGTAAGAAVMVLTQIAMAILQHSKVVETAVRGVAEPMGASERDIMIATMVVTVVASVAVGIGAGAGGMVGASRSAGQSAGLSAKVTAKLGQHSTKIQTLLTKVDSKITAQNVEKLQAHSQKLQALSAAAQLGASGLSAGASIYQGYIQMEQAELKEKEGELDALIELLKDLIKSLEGILESIRSDIEQSQEVGSKERQQYEGLGEMFETIIQNWTEMLNQITAAGDAYAGQGGGHAA